MLWDRQARPHGGKGCNCPPMIFRFFRLFVFLVFCCCLIVCSAVGHGHDNTPTPLSNN